MQCVFADDSDGNIENATGVCGTLDITERMGMDYTDMEYLEQRARLPCDDTDGVTSKYYHYSICSFLFICFNFVYSCF